MVSNRVLVVEDDSEIGVVFKRYSEILQFECDLASSLDDALYLLKKSLERNLRYDFTFLDMNISDTEFGPNIKQKLEEIDGNTQYIFMSALEGIAPEGYTFISKPFTLKDIRKIIYSS